MRASIDKLVPYSPGIQVEELEKRIGRPIVKLSANESLWGPSPAILPGLREKLNQLMFYPDGAGQALKTALGKLWDLEDNHFCLGNGADELIFLIAAAFLNPGDEVLIPTPTFSEYAVSVTICGGICRNLPQPKLELELGLIADGITPQTKMVFLCNPNNPTGTAFGHQELVKFLAHLKTLPQKVIVVLDEAYCHFATDPNFPDSAKLLPEYRDLLVLRTFSKVYSLAALRVGYAVAAPELIKELDKVRQPFNVNALGQWAAVLALNDEEYVDKVVAETAKEREWLTRQLTGLGMKVLPSQANFILALLTEDARPLAEKLLTKGLQVRNTASFAIPQGLRITVGPHEFMERLIGAVKEVQ